MRRWARLLLVVGTATTVFGLSKAHAAVNAYDYTGSFRFAWSLFYIAILVVAAYGAGLPDLTLTRRSAVGATVASTFVAALAISLLQLVVGAGVLPRFVIFTTPAVLVPVYALCAAFAHDGGRRDASRDRLLVVAGVDEAAELADGLAASPERPGLIVAVLTPDEAVSGAPGGRPLVHAAVTSRATTVVLDRAAQLDDAIVAQAASLHESGVRVRTLSLCFDECLGKLPISELERVSLMFDIGELHRVRYGRLKRIVDILAGMAGTAAAALVAPVVMLGNAVANRGPLLYRQPRLGKNGRPFEILKFRTMARGIEGGPHWTSPADPRITPFGAWLRRTHLDELPQALNILRGDLSIVGPRPEQPHYVEELTEKVPFYHLRHLVRPGLTGWAQVKYQYGDSVADALEKLQYEFYYLRHQGLALDLRILGRTVRTVVRGQGR